MAKKPKGPSSPGKKRFHNHVEKAIAHNETAPEAERKSVHVHYQKLNGRTVKRKISPLKMNGHTIIAYDHKRKALRSFRMERVKHMEKVAKDVNSKAELHAWMAKHPEGQRYVPHAVGNGDYTVTPVDGDGSEHFHSYDHHEGGQPHVTEGNYAAMGKKHAYLSHENGTGQWGMKSSAKLAKGPMSKGEVLEHFDHDGGEKTAFFRGFEKGAMSHAKSLAIAGGIGGAAVGVDGALALAAHPGLGHIPASHRVAGGVASGLAGASLGYVVGRHMDKKHEKAREAEKSAFVHSTAFGHAKNVAEVGGLGILGKGAYDDYKNSDRGAHAKKKLALEGAGLGILGVPAAAELGHAAWTGGKQLLGKFHK